MRRAFADTLTEVAEKNDRIIFLTGDLGFQVFDEFEEKFGRRYVNVGVAEAQLVDCAAGLALEGWRPIVYSIASFMTGRAFEQIRLSICYHNLPIVVVGAGGGYTYGSSGVTHHAQEDLGLMSLLPNMTVVAPGDPGEITQLLPQLLELDGPSYIRVGKFGEPCYQADNPAIVKKARLIREGSRVAIVTTGGQAVHAIAAADHLKADGILPVVCQMHTIKPLDSAFLDQLVGRVDSFIVVEEHGVNGGLGAAMNAWRAGRGENIRLLRLGPGDELVLGSPTQDEICHRLNYDADSIAQACREAWLTS